MALQLSKMLTKDFFNFGKAKKLLPTLITLHLLQKYINAIWEKLIKPRL
jgi:hypothetical protein